MLLIQIQSDTLPDNGCMRRCSLLRNNRFGAELRDVFGLSFPAPLISRLLSVGSVSVLLFPISVFFVITTEDFSVVCFIGSDCSTVSFRLSSLCSEISGITLRRSIHQRIEDEAVSVIL